MLHQTTKRDGATVTSEGLAAPGAPVTDTRKADRSIVGRARVAGATGRSRGASLMDCGTTICRRAVLAAPKGS
jgi:hypothetical protein